MTDKARGLAERIAAATGGPVHRIGSEWRVLCPRHESDSLSHRPSLAVWTTSTGRAAFNCMTGCPWSDVRAALLAKGIALDASSTIRPAQNEDHATSIRQARELFANAATLCDEDASMRYLASRSIIPREGECECMRTARGSTMGRFLFLQAIVDPYTIDQADWRAVGVQLLRIDAAGVPETTVVNGKHKKIRRILGQRRGCGVVIGKPCDEVVIGEGVETTWSAMRCFGMPFGIATLGPMSHLNMPTFVRHMTIAADHDPAGTESAMQAGRFWDQHGYKVVVRQPKYPGDDFNDVWMKQRSKS